MTRTTTIQTNPRGGGKMPTYAALLSDHEKFSKLTVRLIGERMALLDALKELREVLGQTAYREAIGSEHGKKLFAAYEMAGAAIAQAEGR